MAAIDDAASISSSTAVGFTPRNGAGSTCFSVSRRRGAVAARSHPDGLINDNEASRLKNVEKRTSDIATSSQDSMWNEFADEAARLVAERGEIHRNWSTIKAAAGRKQTTQDQREALWAALEERGLWTYPGVDVVNPASRERVYIFPKEQSTKRFGLRFQNEKQFEDAIIGGLDRIKALQGIRLIEQQYYLSTGRKIDILCRRGRDKWVIIEVESGDGHTETPTQVKRYVDDLRQQKDESGDPLVKDNQSIEAIVISQAYDDSSGEALQSLARSHDFGARWLVAKIEFDEK